MKKVIALGGFEESYFETEWLSQFRQTKERTDIDPETKKTNWEYVCWFIKTTLGARTRGV